MKKLYIIGLLALGFASCKPNIEPSKADKGKADFTRYVAVGNSLTAGYSDNALYKSGQQNSYPAMLAGQFALVGGGVFRQPLLPGEYGWLSTRLVLDMRLGSCDTAASLSPVPYNGAVDSSGSSISIAKDGPYHNMGVPGIRCIDFLVRGYGMLNPYAKRFFLNPAGSTPAEEAVVLHPTFFTLWIGANDVLGYATAGGDEAIPDPFGRNTLSNTNLFNTAYDSIIHNLRREGAQGVLLNIPDITAIPFFTTIHANGLVLNKNQVYILNNAYNNAPGIRFEEGNNYFLIVDSTAPAKFRHMLPGEYVLLSDVTGQVSLMDSIKCKGWGSTKPIPRRFVLTLNEVEKIRTKINEFNTIIAAMAKRENLAFVDVNSYMKMLQSSIIYNGAMFNANFVQGGAFSLDGVHLTPRGYALVANQIINAINAKYESTLPMVDVNKYNGVLFP